MLRYAGHSEQTVRTAEFLVPDVMPFVGVLLALVTTVIATIPSTIPAAKLDLPPSAMCSCIAAPEPPRIRVFATGITVNDRPSSLNSLLSDVHNAQGRNERQDQRNSVVLSGEAETPYGKVAEVVDRLSVAGFRVSMHTQDMT